MFSAGRKTIGWVGDLINDLILGAMDRRSGNAGNLSFPMRGWTLSLDLPVTHGPALGELLDDLDDAAGASAFDAAARVSTGAGFSGSADEPGAATSFQFTVEPSA